MQTYSQIVLRQHGCVEYDRAFWDRYADENESRYNEAFARFVRDLATSLKCTSVLEIGCGTGIDLRLFTDDFKVHGVDLNDRALDIARQGSSHGDFRNADIAALPFKDSEVDFVFTHGLLNYLDDHTLEKAVPEMYRVAGRYIMNCEMFAEQEDQMNQNARFRNMYGRWLDQKVKIISNVDMHEDIEPDKARFTLLRKL